MKRIRFKQSSAQDLKERHNTIDNIVSAIYNYDKDGLTVNNVRAEYRRNNNIKKRKENRNDRQVFGALVGVCFKRLGWKRNGKRWYKG